MVNFEETVLLPSGESVKLQMSFESLNQVTLERIKAKVSEFPQIKNDNSFDAKEPFEVEILSPISNSFVALKSQKDVETHFASHLHLKIVQKQKKQRLKKSPSADKPKEIKKEGKSDKKDLTHPKEDDKAKKLVKVPSIGSYFGMSLAEVIEKQGGIPKLVQQSLDYIRKHGKSSEPTVMILMLSVGMDEEGVFRVSGTASHVEELRKEYDKSKAAQ